jgi:hypothetical protein
MKVVRVGLENAASVAGVLLLSEATLTEIEEKREEPQPPGWPVAALDRERMLVFDIRRPRLHITWSFLLTPLAGDRTRLVLRYRGLVQPRLAELPSTH